MKHLPILALLIMLSACSSTPYDSLGAYLHKRGIEKPTKDTFATCRAYGCQKVDIIELKPEEWAKIDAIFQPKANAAKAERHKITKAIATFETIVGDINGTSEDIWGTFQKTGHKQQDCVDESTNTSIYLLALQQRGHIKFHDINIPQSRVPFLKWPHQTATITDKQTNEKFAVDSWFHNNGIPPEIIPFKTWKKGWKPTQNRTEKVTEQD